jgi:hypothetical protein
VANRVADGFLGNPQELVPGHRRQSLFGYMARVKITSQATGDIGTLDQRLQRLNQSRPLGERGLEAEGRPTCLRQTKLGELGCPLQVSQALVISPVKHLLGRPQLHRDPGEKLGQRVVDFARHLVALLQHGRLPSSIRQAGKLNGQAGLGR